MPILLAAVALSGSPLAAQESRPASLDDLKREIAKTLADHNIAGATVALVSRDSVIWTGGVGLSNAATGEPAGARTLFRWGSVSKSFVAVAAQILVERGLLDLDTKIGDIAPEIEFHNPWESTDPVTIAHCLEHTTGFDDLHFNDCAVNEPDIPLSAALAINPNSRRCRWRPGTFRSYSNVGPVIVAYIIEKVSGQTFEEFVRTNVFAPLEMTTASFFYPSEPGLMSSGYGDDGVGEIEYDHIALRPAGSLNASAADMAGFVCMLLNRGMFNGIQMLRPASVERMETPTTTLAAQAGFRLGYGLGNYTSVKDGYIFHGHGGMIAGFVASYGYNVALDRGFAVSINGRSDKALERIRTAIVAYFTAGMDRPLRQAVELSADQLSPLTGYYRSATPMTQLLYTLLFRFTNTRHVSLDQGRLYSGNYLGGKRSALIPQADGSFHREGRGENLFFVDDRNSIIVSYDNLRGNFRRASAFSVFFELSVFILSLLVMMSSAVFALVWIPRMAFGRLAKTAHLKARVFPLLAVLCFFFVYIALLVGVMQIELDKNLMRSLGFLTPLSFAIFAASLCFAVFAFLGLYFSVRALARGPNRADAIHALLVSAVNVVAVIYLWHGGIIGIMTWAY